MRLRGCTESLPGMWEIDGDTVAYTYLQKYDDGSKDEGTDTTSKESWADEVRIGDIPSDVKKTGTETLGTNFGKVKCDIYEDGDDD